MPHRRRTTFTVLCAVLLLAAASLGCSASGKPGATRSGTAASSASPSRPTGRTAERSPVADPDVLEFLVLRRAAGTAEDGYSVMEAQSGNVAMNLPLGVFAADWKTLYTAEAAGAATIVGIHSPEGGDVRGQIDVDGAWRLPVVSRREPTGLSEDGRTLILEAAGAHDGAGKMTRFAIVSTDRSKPNRVVELAGDFSFDAVSPDGSWLYVIEHLSGGGEVAYHVRRVDLATGRLAEGIVVDKRNPDEVMAGTPVSQLAAANGWFYTLYRDGDEAFVHALSTLDGTAFCIDLPAAAKDRSAAAGGWALALDRWQRTLLAANATAGLVSEVNLTDFSIRTAAVRTAAGSVGFAKFESGDWSTGGGAAISSDGKTLFAGGAHGILAVRRSDLSTMARLGGDRAYTSLASGSSGTLYAVDAKGGAWRIDADPSRAAAALGERGYAEIVALVTLR